MRLCLSALIFVASAACAEDLRLVPDQVKAGRQLYVQHCASCHGVAAEGGSAMDIQGSIPPDVVDAVQGTGSMPAIDVTKAQAQDIAVYLMSLAPDQAKRRLGIRASHQ